MLQLFNNFNNFNQSSILNLSWSFGSLITSDHICFLSPLTWAMPRTAKRRMLSNSGLSRWGIWIGFTRRCSQSRKTLKVRNGNWRRWGRSETNLISQTQSTWFDRTWLDLSNWQILSLTSDILQYWLVNNLTDRTGLVQWYWSDRSYLFLVTEACMFVHVNCN